MRGAALEQGFAPALDPCCLGAYPGPRWFRQFASLLVLALYARELVEAEPLIAVE